MQKLEHILFPVDLSAACRSMAPTVRSLACRTGAKVTLLNVLDMPPNYYSDPNAFLTLVDVTGLLREQRSKFELFLRPELDDLPKVTRISKHGDAARIIVDYAAKQNVDLIMMPTHGLGPFRRFLLGSVTAKVLHDSHCPVWTSDHDGEGNLPPSRVFQILCAVDLTPDHVATMRYADDFARMFGAQLRFLHVVPAIPGFAANYCDAEFVAGVSDAARQQLLQMQEKADSTGEAVIRSGKLSKAVRNEAVEWNAGLIVIGRGVLQEPLGRLRSQTCSILRESPCPVLSV